MENAMKYMKNIRIDAEIIPNIMGLQFLFCHEQLIDFEEGKYEKFNGIIIVILCLQFSLGYTVK